MNEVVVGTSYGLRLNHHNVDSENVTEVTLRAVLKFIRYFYISHNTLFWLLKSLRNLCF